MRNKMTISGFTSVLWTIVLLSAIVTLNSSLWGESEIRTYKEPEPVVPGEAESRELKIGEPSPYFATAPFAISLAPMLEAPSDKWDVMLLRLNILVGNHRSVQFLDLGVIGNFSDYKMNGFGIAGIFNSMGESEGAFSIAGVVNFVAFDYSGCQVSGIYSCTEGTHLGVQIGIGNYAGRLSGVQIGAVNRTEKGAGLQIGVFNSAESLEGIQIGILNINKSSAVPFLPIVNLAF